MGGGDDQSFFSASQLPSVTGDGEAFVPSKMGYLHIKNQVGLKQKTCVPASAAPDDLELGRPSVTL